MRRIIRTVLIVGVLSAIVIVGVQIINYNNSLPTQEPISEIIDQTVVEVGELTVTVSGTGAITPVRQVPLVFEVTAPVTEVLVKRGDIVVQGDVLARLDTIDFEANVNDAQIAVEAQQLAFDALTAPPREVDLAVAEASLTAAQASYNAALATAPSDTQIETARLQTELARNQLWQSQLQADGFSPESIVLPPGLPPELERFIYDTIDGINAQNRLQYQGAIESLEYGIDIADANYSSVQSKGPDLGSVNSAYAGVVQAQVALDRLKNGASDSEIQQAQIDLDTTKLALQQAQEVLDKAGLTAPFDGVIAENNLIVGQFPPTGQTALLLIDTSSYYIDVPIDETDIISVQLGQIVEVTLDALPGEALTGKVTQVGITPTTVGQLVTYLVRVELDSTNAPIRVGMSATARIITQRLNDTVIVRNRFIRIDRETQKAYVTVDNLDGTYSELEVGLGLRNDVYSQITSGVTVGQPLVLLPRGTFIPGVGTTR